jgi:hypothetical protein
MVAPPLYFCSGILRSGSTWSYNVCRLLGVVLSVKARQPLGATYLLDNQLEKFLAEEGNALKGPTVIKTHRVLSLGLQYLQSGKAKAVCTYRDPRDCVVSVHTFTGADMDQVAIGIASSLEYLKHYQESSNTLFIRYEEMMADSRKEIDRIVAHLGIQVDSKILDRIDQQTNLEGSREICEDIKKRAQAQGDHTGKRAIDLVTHLHGNHIYSAKSGRWRTELTSQQAQSYSELFRPYLLSLGYETQESFAALRAQLQAANSTPRRSRPSEVTNAATTNMTAAETASVFA